MAVSVPVVPLPTGPVRVRSHVVAGPAGSGWGSDWTQMQRLVSDECAVRDGGRVAVVVGDSTASRDRSRVTAALRAQGFSVCSDVRGARPTGPMSVDLAGLAALPSADVLVVESGSNDIFDPSAMPVAVARVLRLAGGRPVVWVNTYVRRWSVRPAFQAADLRNSQRVDAVLRAAAATHPNLHIVDWYAYVTGGPTRASVLLADGVHQTDLGARWRSCSVAAAVARWAG